MPHPHFSLEDQYPELPSRLVAQVDYVDIDAGSGKAVVGYDAIDQTILERWAEGFAPVETVLKQLLKLMRFGHPVPTRALFPFDKFPIFHIRRPEADVKARLQDAQTGQWLLLSLEPSAQGDSEVYSSLFGEPRAASVSASGRPPQRLARLLSLITGPFSPLWKSSSSAAITLALKRAEAAFLGVLDVGQGSASALLKGSLRPTCYYDLGTGVYQNRGTRPRGLQFCHDADTPVILSHWDTDHWAGATVDTRFLKSTWIVPHQVITMKHLAFHDDIIKAGGTVLVMGRGGSSTVPLANGTTLQLSRGTGVDRNDSGIVALVTATNTMDQWLLTGDCDYDCIPAARSGQFSAVVVPHHGAAPHPGSSAPARTSAAYARLAYSFGPGNRNGPRMISHPRPDSITQHSRAGTWKAGTWAGAAAPGNSPAGGDILATAQHRTTHLGDILIGWSHPGTAPGRPCGSAGCGKTRTCSINFCQI